MEHKYSPILQAEIEQILENIKQFNKLFSINIEYFIDGWALFLFEKSIYPRQIVIFKSYNHNSFSVKSFEVKSNNNGKEEFEELYSIKNLNTIDLLIKELKEIIYGKDIMHYTSKNYFDNFKK
ncbi:MAG: hypothetical protein EU532_05155 [Promethearchaeota archaeon]|nr:MAG: hypothetical protein EU532_05155 [Candidatus Lokiarchaeota archaeon]